jgi:putative oxidoreductase
MINGINDELIVAARLLLAALFLIFGWRKLADYSGTVLFFFIRWELH